MKMRELNGQDTFMLLPIFAKAGITPAMKRFAAIKSDVNASDEDKSNEELGMEVIGELLGVLFENLPKAQKDINKLLANLCDTTQKEIEALDFSTYNMLIVELFSQEAFTNFFKQLIS